jgi:catechol 1,2-dioxygenase
MIHKKRQPTPSVTETPTAGPLVSRRSVAAGLGAGYASLWLSACSGNEGFVFSGGSAGSGGAMETGGSAGSSSGGSAGAQGTGGANASGGGGNQGGGDDAGASTGGSGGPQVEGGTPVGGGDGATPACADGPTDDNVEGPFYRAGAPERSVLATSADGEVLILTGLVQNTRCMALGGALLDVWHSDAVDGMAQYDTSSPAYRFRGKLRADAGGAYKLETILPGHYLNGDTLRVRHIHFKISQDGHLPLTTQVEFQGDSAEAQDDFSKLTLAVPLTKVDGVWRATFDIVLVPGQLTIAPPRRPVSPVTRRSFLGAGRWG